MGLKLQGQVPKTLLSKYPEGAPTSLEHSLNYGQIGPLPDFSGSGYLLVSPPMRIRGRKNQLPLNGARTPWRCTSWQRYLEEDVCTTPRYESRLV